MFTFSLRKNICQSPLMLPQWILACLVFDFVIRKWLYTCSLKHGNNISCVTNGIGYSYGVYAVNNVLTKPVFKDYNSVQALGTMGIMFFKVFV